jgi:hypothetical protein
MTKTDLSISMAKANIYSLLFALPLAGLISYLFITRWGGTRFSEGLNIYFGNLALFFLTFILGIVVHELIHGFTWMVAGKKSIHTIKFGFQVSTLTPYAHCKEPLSVNAYRLGALMPGLLLGFVPAFIAIITGNGWVMAFSLVFTVAACGDFLILWLLRSVTSNKFVEDHPSQAGCYVLDKVE